MTLTQDFMVQITALRTEIEKQKKRHEDQLYDKDTEMDTIQKIISMKDVKINELQTKLDLNRHAAEENNMNDLGEFFNDDAENELDYKVDKATPRGGLGGELRLSHDGYDIQLSAGRG